MYGYLELSDICRIFSGRLSYYRLAARVRSGAIPAVRGSKSWFIHPKHLRLIEREFGIARQSSDAEIAA